MIDDLLKTRDVAELLSVSVRTVWRWTRNGQLPKPIYLSSSPRWRVSDIDKFLHTLTFSRARPDKE